MKAQDKIVEGAGPFLEEGEHVLAAIGAGEVIIALWMLSGYAPRLGAAAQTVCLLSMNVVELTFARHLLLWPSLLLP